MVKKDTTNREIKKVKTMVNNSKMVSRNEKWHKKKYNMKILGKREKMSIESF